MMMMTMMTTTMTDLTTENSLLQSLLQRRSFEIFNSCRPCKILLPLLVLVVVVVVPSKCSDGLVKAWSPSYPTKPRPRPHQHWKQHRYQIRSIDHRTTHHLGMQSVDPPTVKSLTTTKNSPFRFHAVTANFVVVVMAMISNILIFDPSPSIAATVTNGSSKTPSDEYQNHRHTSWSSHECPSSFSFPELGIQNVINTSSSSKTSQSITMDKATVMKTNHKSTKKSFGLDSSVVSSQNSRSGALTVSRRQCPTATNDDDTRGPFTLQMVVYAPSPILPLLESSSKKNNYDHEQQERLVLDVTVFSSSSSSSSMSAFAGATIPFSQIERFPVALSLSSHNLALRNANNNDDGPKSSSAIDIPYDDDWTVVVTVRHDNDNNKSNNNKVDDVLVQGTGTARRLMLPMGSRNGNDDDDQLLVPVRAAASIRLSASTIPDRLLMW